MGVTKKFYKDILYYEIEGFNQFKNITHLFSTRIGWDQKNIFDDLGKILGLNDDRIYRAKQVHGKEIIIIGNQDNKTIGQEEADGFITKVKGIALCTYHADCVPIYFYDKGEDVIGIAHAGWKGTLNNIAGVIIDNMVKEYGSNLSNIVVAIGPSIGACCYEIGEDVEKLFNETFDNPEIIIDKNEKIYLDLWKVNYINLLDAGIKEGNIYQSNFCTACNLDTLYSYRKEKATKNRMIAAITLNE
ncbi:MAG: peptidoglycan editing factor PgeF [Tissierellia bacterium]|nr:peptidoglycan editing factor PgeF [Tissierellia bacterium]